MKLNGLDPTDISHLMQSIETKWNENMSLLEEINSSSDRRDFERRAVEELSTLRDVHDGYNKYIQSAEELSLNDSQKLSMQLETNKVN